MMSFPRPESLSFFAPVLELVQWDRHVPDRAVRVGLGDLPHVAAVIAAVEVHRRFVAGTFE